MGAYFSIDVTDLKMFARYEWHDLGEPCDHGCEHRNQAVIGWGPTVATYELTECRDCWCRAWQDGRWTQERQRHTGMEPFWMQQMDWRKVERSAGEP
jgi:hypothetical protein